MSEETVKINVNVAGRSYPLTVKAEEEEALRKAGKSINETIREFETKYHVSDRQDALAMCALHMASLLEMKRSESSTNDGFYQKKIREANQQLDIILNNSQEILTENAS